MARIRIALLSIAAVGASINVAYAGTYSICQGEYSEPNKGSHCPKGQPYVYCPTDNANTVLRNKAASLCAQEGSTGTPKVVQLRTEGGNKCGYGFYQVTCQ